MKRFYNKHKDERAFIICNGPGLNDIDVTKLNDSIVFIMNRGYLLADRGLNISNTYFVSIDELIQSQFKKEMEAVKCRAKFANRISGANKMRWTGDIKKFSKDITKPIWQGHSVTNTALQIAYYMGCTPVYIVGMDHYISYKEYDKSTGNYKVLTKDSNHFDSNYYPKGYTFHGQDLGAVEIGYGLATEAYWSSGRELYNASTRTRLDESIMPRIDFDEIDP
jgi:hypothetical protein